MRPSARKLAKITSDIEATIKYLNAVDLYVCLARLDECYRFITSDNKALRQELFESNVRDYAGSTAVNNAIGDTLRSGTGEDFWWFNNGVTVVADAGRRSPARRSSSKTPRS
ncbi:AIPR family protein [Streptomyces sp. NPDC058734]|uniref:AIPR family protein n=1 Tax=Streptomyces sp. NPDC058734 TaxID=3346615 RepID=UPI00368002E2